MSKNESFDTDPYFIGYYMMVNTFNKTDIRDGIKSSLQMVRVFLSARDVILFELDEHGNFFPLKDLSDVKNGYDLVTILLNKMKGSIMQKEYYSLDVCGNMNLMNAYFFPISTSEHSYMLSFTNVSDKIHDTNDMFIHILNHSMPIIMERLETYVKVQRSAYEDGLTELYNRQKYNEKLKEVDEHLDTSYVFGIFDLFRLKYVNDNYSHKLGDEYIKKAAFLLRKYFPETITSYDSKGNLKSIPTGTSIYRIGGDEFVVIASQESKELVESKAQLVAEEMKSISLGEDVDVPLGLNYGISTREVYEKSNELYVAADKMLQDDKTAMYKVLGIDRRK